MSSFSEAVRYLMEKVGLGFDLSKVINGLQTGVSETFWDGLGNRMGSSEKIRQGYKASIEMITENPHEVGTLVEFGSAKGYVPIQLVSEGRVSKAIGIDYNKEAVEEATRLAERDGLQDRVSFVYCDGTNLDSVRGIVPEASADVVRAHGYLEYLPKDKLDDGIAEMIRTLKPGGQLIVGTTAPPEYWEGNPIKNKIECTMFDKLRGLYGLYQNRVGRDELIKILEKHGVEIKRGTTKGAYWILKGVKPLEAELEEPLEVKVLRKTPVSDTA